jgi:hypothetical protein
VDRPPSELPQKVQLRTSLDRRRAEALALEIRRRLKTLGVEGASITVAPESKPAE